MKKQILSVVLMLTMLIASVSTVFAEQPVISDSANVFYEGNKPFILMEKLLDELNADQEANIFDNKVHKYQKYYIDGANSVVETLLVSDLAEAIDLLTADLSDAQKMYLAACVKAYEDGDEAIEEGLKRHDTTDKSLKESFGLLDDYVDEMSAFLSQQGINKETYDNDPDVISEARKYVAEPLMAILKVIFAEDKDDMRESYYIDFLTNDRAKKTLAVLFGSELTKEIVTDNFLSDSSDDANDGIVHHLKEYLKSLSASELRDVKSTVENGILVTDKADSVSAAFDFIGGLVTAAYENDPQASDSLKASVKMLMGDSTEPGLIELMVKAVDEDNEYTASNVWINLFLSEFIQTNLVGSALNSVSAENPNPQKATIRNGTSVYFKNENLADYGVDDRAVSLGTGKFRLGFYIADPSYIPPAPGGASGSGNGGGYTSYQAPTFEGYIESPYITYNEQNGKIIVERDSSKGNGEYEAYMVLYRGDSIYRETFIESYPVMVVNPSVSSGGGSSKIFIHYNTNGGEPISSTSHVRGTTVQLSAVPVREGYIFTGWYSDAALTQKIDSVTVNASTTVYAGWKKDGSTVVSVVDIPELLDGEHHYAYIMGYPEGDVRPYGNITRAETVTMVFRLLKDSVRTSNLTETNSFHDVNESDWFNTAVSTLAGMGVVEGRTETEFMPNANITRAEFATIFARLAEFDAVAEQNYSDINGHWAEDYIYEASAYGWIAGYEDDTFRPDKAINRAEAMTLVNRVLKRVPQSKEDLLTGMIVWNDNTDTTAWYYLAVQEATNSHEFVMKDESYEKWTVLTENRDWTAFEK